MIDYLRQMAIFAKAMDHGSFRGAARELRLSPSVISHHISQLEEHLGVALIYRTTRKLALTKDGERLLSATQKMLGVIEDELQGLYSLAGEPSGELRITLPSVLSQSKFISKIAAFSAQYPRIRLSLDFSDLRRELIDDRYDLAIRMSVTSKDSTTSRKLFDVRRRLVASTTYLSTRTIPDDPNGLLDWDWIILDQVQNGLLSFHNPKCKKVSIKPNNRMSTNDAQSLYHLARAGAGLAIVPDFLAEDAVKSGEMAFVLPEWELPTLDVFAAWPVNAPRHGLIHLALDSFTVASRKGVP